MAPAAVVILTGDRHIEDKPVPDNEAGSLSLEGILTVGALDVSSIDTSGFALEHVDKSSPDPDNDVISFIANENYSATWNWAYGNPTSTLQMVLDKDNILTLYGSSNVVLDPDTGKITIGTSDVLTDSGIGGSGSLLVTGSGTGGIPVEGAGTRMMWYMDKGAFRAGTVSSTQWDDTNIGNSSVAMGTQTTASGTGSVAMGRITTASGQYSTAFGILTSATGQSSTAFGQETTASGLYSIAGGYKSDALGNHSVAMGEDTTASGLSSTAFGKNTTAGGDYSMAVGLSAYVSPTADQSVAMSGGYVSGTYSAAFGQSAAYGNNATAWGYGATAGGNYSTAWGESAAYGDYATAWGSSYNYADGDYATVIGVNNWAVANNSIAAGTGLETHSYSAVAVGHFNEDFYDSAESTAQTAWQDNSQHSVFEVGVGLAYNNRKNGFTVFQDGSVDVGKATDDDNSVPLKIAADGSVTLSKEQGDISMGLFGN